jgi:hypothetical protein
MATPKKEALGALIFAANPYSNDMSLTQVRARKSMSQTSTSRKKPNTQQRGCSRGSRKTYSIVIRRVRKATSTWSQTTCRLALRAPAAASPPAPAGRLLKFRPAGALPFSNRRRGGRRR